jgi:hypothetical protein
MTLGPKKVWTIEEVRKLADGEIANLRDNTMKANRPDIASMCQVVLAEQAAKKKRAANTKQAANKQTFEISSNAVNAIIAKISKLPRIEQSPNGMARLRLQKQPVKTLQELWKLFLVCGFSSQENSEEDGRLAKFISKNGPLFNLQAVNEKRSDLREWVAKQLSADLPRLLENKVNLVVSAHSHFYGAGNPKDELEKLTPKTEALKLFCELASGKINDHQIATSGEFSRRIDHSFFSFIGDKQIRNILVNSGLAHNVVPLDSRWRNFFGDAIRPEKFTLTRSRYLALEDLLRTALTNAQDQGSSITNLSILDAIVFEHMSKGGIGDAGWGGLSPL